MARLKKQWLLFTVLMLAGLIGPAQTSLANEQETQSANADQPNILMIFLDDYGWKDAGFMGSDFYETPNIDRLASGGMVFTNAYSCAANCAPARACLLSGQYTPRHQIYNVGTKPRGSAKHRRLEHIPGVDTLDPKIRTWAAQIQSAGYATASLGKWHLSDDPCPYGFDLNVGGTHSGSPPKGYYPPHGNAPGLGDAPQDEYLTDTLSAAACKFIEEHQSQPWLLYLTHFAVHTPIQAKKELLPKYEAKPPGKIHGNAKMATMVQAVDDGVGEIVETLERLKIRDKTVIVFFSDNGGYGPATDMEPLKGYKGTYYEGGIRVPFFVNWPGQVQKNTECHEPMIGVDLFPTLCEMAGVKMPEGQIADGKSLVPLLTGKVKNLDEAGQPRALFWHFPAYLSSYSGRFNLEQRDALFRSRPCSAIRKGDWKLIQFFESGEKELYNLSDDIAEAHNVAGKNPEIVDSLFEELQRWQVETQAAIPSQPNPEFSAEAEREAIERMSQKRTGKQRKRGTRKKAKPAVKADSGDQL